MASLLDGLADNRDDMLEEEKIQVPHNVSNKRKLKKALKKRSTLMTIILTIICMLVVFFASVWIPSIWGRGKDRTGIMTAGGNWISFQDYVSKMMLEEYMYEDIDGDGVINGQEQNYGCFLYKADTDCDGVSDGAEVVSTITDPNKFNDTYIKYVEEKDAAAGKRITSPYAMNNVILWADEYKDKALGSVETSINNVYFFDNFNGWARFVNDNIAVAYDGEDFKELEYREVEKAYRITEDIDTVLFVDSVSYTYVLTMFGEEITVEDGKLAHFLDTILPADGNTYLKIRRQMKVNDNISKRKTTEIVLPIYEDYYDFSYLSRNENVLSDLNRIYKAIDTGKCVLGSLHNTDSGEYKFIVYGYDYFGNLLTADLACKPTGILKVVPKMKTVLCEDGVETIEYYDFYTTDFNSEDTDWGISFIAIQE